LAKGFSDRHLTGENMAINLKTTSSIATSHINILCYGQSGSGKTTLIKTLPKPIILSAESGLRSLDGTDIPYIEVETMDDLKEAYSWLKNEGGEYSSVAIDSISEIGEVVLSEEKQKSKDPRQAYGALADSMMSIIRAFRNLPMHVYMTAKLSQVQDDVGKLFWGPSMPGSKTGQQLPYLFDEVLAMRFGKTDDKEWRGLMCKGDTSWIAKDRSGKLSDWEDPDLGKLIAKIGGQDA
jgi:phage nucleotide-binding protein